MLVEPQRTRDGLPVGCTGVTMEDGRVFRATRDGHIDVDDTRTAQQMVANPLAPGFVMEQKFGGGGVPGVVCGTCGFGGFLFHASAPCPRCGAQDWEHDGSPGAGDPQREQPAAETSPVAPLAPDVSGKDIK